MTISFALSRPENEKNSSIIAIIRYGDYRLNYALNISVPVKFWDKKNRQVKETKLFCAN